MDDIESATRLSNLDIMDNDLPFGLVDCIYVDPPWGESNLKYWRTLNDQCGHEVSWTGFMDRLFAVCSQHCPEGPWWIETGMRFSDEVISRSPLPCNYTLECQYRAGKKWLPNMLLLFGGDEPSEDPEKNHGIHLVKWALSNLPKGSEVLDPCCGLGTTAKACKRLNLEFYGNELNKKRLEKTKNVM